MAEGISAIRQEFLASINSEILDLTALDNEISLYSKNDGDVAKTCQISVHYPQMIHGNLNESFPKDLMNNCNDMLVGISKGNQKNPPHKGGWVPEGENYLIEDDMININYDVEINKIGSFAKRLHQVISIIQTQLKQMCVYVRIDDDKIHADVLKLASNSYPPPESYRSTTTDSDGNIYLEGIDLGSIKIGKLSINEDMLGTVLANLMQISGGF